MDLKQYLYELWPGQEVRREHKVARHVIHWCKKCEEYKQYEEDPIAVQE